MRTAYGPAVSRRPCLVALGLCLGLVPLGLPAHAHPHIWVDVATTVLYERGSFVGVRQTWTFDEFYTAQAIEGLDKNGDGTLDRDELAELAKVNMEGLKEFDYFTFPRLSGQALKLGDPTEAYLEHVVVTAPPGPGAADASPLPGSGAATPVTPAEPAGKETLRQEPGFWSRVWSAILGEPAPATSEAKGPRVLRLVFTVPLAQPVLAEADGFDLTTYDPSFFIWFEASKKDAIRISDGAPKTCEISFREGEKSATDVQRLGEAFFSQLGGAGFGFSAAKTSTIRCATS